MKTDRGASSKLHVKTGIAAVIVLALVATACGAADDVVPTNDRAIEEETSLTVYSGRKEDFVGPLLDRFETETGITLDVRYGDSAELAATILEEGDASPADVFISQDAGALGAVAAEGLFTEIPEEILTRVDERFRSREGLWVGTSGRARVAAYNTDEVESSELPDSISGFADPAWDGRIGFAPTNASFQAFVAGMIETEGEDATRSFLEALAENSPELYEDNASTVRAVASGEIHAGFVNHYYIYEVSAEDGDIPVANHFFTGGDPGALVNCAGAGILATSEEQEAAESLIDYLTGDEGQRYFAEDTFEYPVVAEYEPSQELPPLEEIQAPNIDLSDLAETIDPALRLLAEVGLL